MKIHPEKSNRKNSRIIEKLKTLYPFNNNYEETVKYMNGKEVLPNMEIRQYEDKDNEESHGDIASYLAKKYANIPVFCKDMCNGLCKKTKKVNGKDIKPTCDICFWAKVQTACKDKKRKKDKYELHNVRLFETMKPFIQSMFITSENGKSKEQSIKNISTRTAGKHEDDIKEDNSHKSEKGKSEENDEVESCENDSEENTDNSEHKTSKLKSGIKNLEVRQAQHSDSNDLVSPYDKPEYPILVQMIQKGEHRFSDLEHFCNTFCFGLCINPNVQPPPWLKIGCKSCDMENIKKACNDKELTENGRYVPEKKEHNNENHY